MQKKELKRSKDLYLTYIGQKLLNIFLSTSELSKKVDMLVAASCPAPQFEPPVTAAALAT